MKSMSAKRLSVVGLAVVVALMGAAAKSGRADILMQDNFDKVRALEASQTDGPGWPRWGVISTSLHPQGVPPQSKPNFCYLECFGLPSGSNLRLFANSVSTVGYENVRVEFCMYQDGNFPDSEDSIQVIVSTNAANWTGLEQPHRRYSGGANNNWWMKYTDYLGDTYENLPQVYIGFRSLNDGGNDMFLDSIVVRADVAGLDSSPSDGTTGTLLTITGNHFGGVAGKAMLVDRAGTAKPVALAVQSWTDTTITALVGKDMGDAACDLQILRKVPSRDPIVVSNTFTFQPPEVLTAASPAAQGDQVTVTGNYFGPKKGKAYLQKDSDPATRIPCKVLTWRMEDDSSSEAVILIPTTVPPDTYDVVIATKLNEGVGSDVLTVVPAL